MIEIIEPRDKDHWLEMRAKDITSTEVSALFGANQYLTKFELWHRKRAGQVVKIEENNFMKWGTRLQDSIAAGIAADEKLNIKRFDGYMRDPELRIGSSFDFFIEDDGILEIKNVGERQFQNAWIVDGDHVEAPLYIEAQVQHQLLLSGRKYAYIGALVGGNQVTLVKREPDPKIHTAIKNAVSAFWVSIEKNDVPAPDFAKDADFIRQLYSFATPEKTIEANAGIALLAQTYKELGDEIKESEDKRKAVKAQMLMEIGDAERVRGANFSISATIIGPKHVEYDAKGYRDFRVNWKKEKV
jgi:putative phage-type endonuclease